MRYKKKLVILPLFLFAAIAAGVLFTISAQRVTPGLQVHPEVRAVLKITPEPKRRIRRDRAALIHNISNPRNRHPQVHRHPVHAQL